MLFLRMLSCIEHVHSFKKRLQNKLCLIVVLVCASTANVNAALIDIAYLSSFINSPDIGAYSIEDTQIGAGYNEFGVNGFETTFVNGLSADNLGTFTWSITNRTGNDLANTQFFSLLDAEITEPGNSFFNEYGTLESITGSGAGDIAADSWEIDEPGLLFGDIYDNIVYGGVLDNTNNVPSGLEEDVSLALGFDVGTFLADQTLLATFTISDQNIGGLSHTDPNSEVRFYFNGTVELLPITVPEPNSLFLLALGLMLYRMRRIAC
jgi:hypothetical protein